MYSTTIRLSLVNVPIYMLVSPFKLEFETTLSITEVLHIGFLDMLVPSPPYEENKVFMYNPHLTLLIIDKVFSEVYPS